MEPAVHWVMILKSLKKDSSNFTQALTNISKSQEKIFFEIINNGKDTSFGEKYDFSHISSVKDFQNRIEPQTYESLWPYIKKTTQGYQNVLTKDPIIFHELSSGSSMPAKLIPYTQKSLHALQAGILPWLHDLISSRPNIKKGRAYFSISPLRIIKDYSGKIHHYSPNNDLSFFGETISTELAKITITDNTIGKIKDIKEWKFKTCLSLLGARDLSLISIWSPTFLGVLLDFIKMNKTSLLDYLEKNLPKRSIELKKIFSKQKLDYEKIWPQLDTISCWMDGSSSIFINNLKNKFPNINFQKKGLISTESLVTIPLSKYNDNILSPLSAFYEFKKENDFFLAHQLLKNCIYEVLITTYSGLYRYQLFDLVKVVDIIDNIPLLKFIGRSNITSDMCGEKLNEDFVLDIFNQVLPHCPKILCACKGQPPYYKLIIETNENVKKLNILIDEKLKQNPHYKLARELGQLDNLVVTTTKSLVNFINKKYPNYYTDGNHKTPILLTLNPQPQNLFQLRSLKDSFLLIQLL